MDASGEEVQAKIFALQDWLASWLVAGLSEESSEKHKGLPRLANKHFLKTNMPMQKQGRQPEDNDSCTTLTRDF